MSTLSNAMYNVEAKCCELIFWSLFIFKCQFNFVERRGNIQCSLILFLQLHYQIIFSCNLKQKDHKVQMYHITLHFNVSLFLISKTFWNIFLLWAIAKFFLQKCLSDSFYKNACLDIKTIFIKRQNHPVVYVFKHTLSICIKILLKWSRKPKYCSLLYTSAIKLLFISFKLKWK